MTGEAVVALGYEQSQGVCQFPGVDPHFVGYALLSVAVRGGCSINPRIQNPFSNGSDRGPDCRPAIGSSGAIHSTKHAQRFCKPRKSLLLTGGSSW